MSERTDVVVVGGGPAGVVAAITLATAGVPVVLLDRARFPRDKPCGGGVRWSVLRRFPDLAGVIRARVAIHEIRKVRMESPSGASVIAEGDDPFYVTLRRVELDAALVDHARTVGARVVEGARAVALERTDTEARVRCADGAEIVASIVIGADGVNSVVARASGLSRGFSDDELAIDTMEETPLGELAPVDMETMYVAYGYRGYPGYGYVFPKRDHVDAGVGFLLSFFKRELRGAPYEHHAAFLEAAAAKGVVKGRSVPTNFKAYRLPLGGPLARTCDDRVMLAGDAGGFVNAYTGEGIYYAMVTGRHAAEAARAALARRACSAAALADYERRWRGEIGDELRDSVRIQRRLFRDPRRADRVIRAAALDPKLCRLLAAVALGAEPLGRRRLELGWRFALASLRGKLGRRPKRT